MSGAAPPVIVIVAVFLILVLSQRTLSRGCDYRCGRCGHRFAPSSVAAALAPHRLGGLKLLRCPQCGATTWASAVQKD